MMDITLRADFLPSQLIDLALEDLAKGEADPRYVICMSSTWHAPINGGCRICFAGAVMAFTLDCPIDEFSQAVGYNSDTRRSFNFLDRIRSGKFKNFEDSIIDTALDYIPTTWIAKFELAVRKYYYDYNSSILFPSYEGTREEWEIELRKFVTCLKEVGL